MPICGGRPPRRRAAAGSSGPVGLADSQGDHRDNRRPRRRSSTGAGQFIPAPGPCDGSYGKVRRHPKAGAPQLAGDLAGLLLVDNPPLLEQDEQSEQARERYAEPPGRRSRTPFVCSKTFPARTLFRIAVACRTRRGLGPESPPLSAVSLRPCCLQKLGSCLGAPCPLPLP